jgi:hypothetical protein
VSDKANTDRNFFIDCTSDADPRISVPAASIASRLCKELLNDETFLQKGSGWV